MSVWFALFAIALDLFFVAGGHLAPVSARVVAVIASALMFAWVLTGFRRGKFPEWTTPLEAALLAAINAASSMPLRAMGVFIAVVQFRALYVTRREFWLLPVSYGVARVVGMSLSPEPLPYAPISTTVLFQFFGVVFISGMLFMLMQALEAQARAESQLREAQKMEAVGQLAGGIAHDFNNLLTVIGGHVYMLGRSAGSNPDVAKHLDGINNTVERAGSLTRQLLAFGRRQVLHPTTVDLNAVVRSAARLLEPVLSERVHLEIELDPQVPSVKADVGQLEQVLLNLGLNARDAMPGGGTLRITTSTVDTGTGRLARVSFADTGAGMDPETLSRVFEPFFTTKRGGRGTGLGLATAYGIIKQSGGEIDVTSAPGKGSTFIISLPELDAVRAEARAVGIPSMPSALKSKRALVVEDSDGVRDFVRAALTSAGMTVNVASDGAEGLAVARAEGYAFDLVVTDIVMPGLSGPQMVERLREARPDLPVLFVTGYADDALARELKAGRNSLLEKPFSARVFLDVVQGVIADAKAPLAVATEAPRT